MYIGKFLIVQIILKNVVEGYYLVQDSIQEVGLDWHISLLLLYSLWLQNKIALLANDQKLH